MSEEDRESQLHKDIIIIVDSQEEQEEEQEEESYERPVLLNHANQLHNLLNKQIDPDCVEIVPPLDLTVPKPKIVKANVANVAKQNPKPKARSADNEQLVLKASDTQTTKQKEISDPFDEFQESPTYELQRRISKRQRKRLKRLEKEKQQQKTKNKDRETGMETMFNAINYYLG